ncbi:MAG: AMP-dependent synthetase and ligase [Bradyrhizobium sp.]|nr:AMP-dependent synthetase and ligase [Bradyrhizobium sp.]
MKPAERDLLTDRLDRWAVERADRKALVFLGDGETETDNLTFAALHGAALGVANRLRPLLVEGSPVLILPRSGIDFAVALLGCLYAGAIAVPCSSGPRNRGWERIEAIAADCRPVAAIGNDEVEGLLARVEALGIPVVRETAGIDVGSLPTFGCPADAPALLQYTSGSTGSPKGVIVTHRNLASNLEMLEVSFGVHDRSVYLTWLPLFHDMGLIGNLLAAMYCGVPCVLMQPLSFYQRPQRWLNAISRFGATISGGPNFAYELLVRRSDRMDLSSVDLSCWDVAFCGAEVVRASTMRRFAESFARTGFKASSLYPCYGLAEATVFVTGSERNQGVRTAANRDGRETVSCGHAAPGERVLIVDPTTAIQLPDGQVGEIWVSGDHVAQGYWKKPELTKSTFAVRTDPEGDDCFLRTGDLGWISRGELYFAGRLKDLIVWRGSNFHPEDIETTTASSSPHFTNANAAFSIDVDNEEQVVLVQELVRPMPAGFDARAAIAGVSRAIVDSHGFAPYDVALVRSGALPRTTSGKVRRKDCRELYCDGSLDDAIHEALRRLRETGR